MDLTDTLCTVCGLPIAVGDYPCVLRPRPHGKSVQTNAFVDYFDVGPDRRRKEGPSLMIDPRVRLVGFLAGMSTCTLLAAIVAAGYWPPTLALVALSGAALTVALWLEPRW